MGRRRYIHAGAEPSLPEMMADPIVHAVMRRDGVTREDLIALLRRAATTVNDGELRGARFPLRPDAVSSQATAGPCE